MTLILGIEKTKVMGGEGRFAMGLVEQRKTMTATLYPTMTGEDLTEDWVRKLGRVRSLSETTLDEYLQLARDSYRVRVSGLS